MLPKQHIESLLTAFMQTRAEVDFAHIFGSFVHREKFEDIDVAVYLNDPAVLNDRVAHPYGYESTVQAELSRMLRTDAVDFVVLNRANLTLFTRVINKGKRILDRDPAKRVAIENDIRHQYIDAEPIRRIQEYYIRRKLKDLRA